MGPWYAGIMMILRRARWRDFGVEGTRVHLHSVEGEGPYMHPHILHSCHGEPFRRLDENAEECDIGRGIKDQGRYSEETGCTFTCLRCGSSHWASYTPDWAVI